MFLEYAKVAERDGDYLGARVNFMKYMEQLKMARASEDVIQSAYREYEEFVKRDPIFVKLLSILLPIIKANPGIIQSDITNKQEAMGWPALYNYDRPVAKEDVYYALYFAEKLGKISRTKKGRSYELRAF